MNPPDFIFVNFSCSPPSLRSLAAGAMAGWSSDLAIEGGRLQVIVNGGDITFPGRGRAYGMMPLVDGENRVEATLVETGGKAGLWRFDFMGSQAIAPGSIRVIGGEIVSVASNAVTFRFKGTPGERVAFTFRKR